MADFITGREIICGAKKAAAWRTALSLGANDGLLITAEALGAKAPQYKPDDSLGNADIKNMIRTLENISGGSITGYLRYEGWDVLMALALGTAGTPTQLSGTAYYNTYSPADSIADLFATFAIKKSGTSHNIWEVPSAKIHGFTISGEVGNLCTIAMNMMGNKIETVSPVNTSLSSVTYPTSTNVARIDSRTKFRMNTQSGGALSDSDIIYPYNFELIYNRPMKENYEAGNTDMSEPVQDGFAEAKLKLTFDKYNLDTFMDAIAAETDQKMDILLEGGLITGGNGQRYLMRFDLPKLTWMTGAADVGGPGVIQHVVEAQLLAVDSAPTGMSGVIDPLSVYVENMRTTDPLG